MLNTKKLFLPLALCVSIITLAGKCNESEPMNSPKITFDLDQIGEDGLSTNPGSEVAVDYEYCIPADEKLAAKLKKIDPTLKVHPKAKGRIGCSQSEWLCMGNTHQKDWRKIIIQIAELDYVKRIDRTFFE